MLTQNHVQLKMGKLKSQKSKAKSNPSTLQTPSMADNNLVITEERKEFMVSPTGSSRERLTTAHFLAPSVTSIDGPIAASATGPSPDSFSSAAATASPAKYKDLPLNVNFRGWRCRTENWKTWVDQMKSSHHWTWKKAGIFDAIMSSTYSIHRNHDQIFGFAKKWCPDTNSFVFPWGEATITLEDMVVLGGYSVLGEFVLSPPENEEIVNKLLSAQSDISRTKSKKALQSKWMAKFMASQSEIEHEAFLAYWLSRFVFPFKEDAIGKSVLPVAIRLARGTKIALAPAVLACIYDSLTLLKSAVIAARKSATKEEQNSVVEITVSAPLALVQVWIWERFPSQRPNPNSMGQKEPRLARWHNLKKSSIGDILHLIDSAADDFQWRPYVNPLSNAYHRKIYTDGEYWELVDSGLDDDLEELVRCLRTSQLVSLEATCIQIYLPHRVAMQFGLDQDLPGHVERVNNFNPEFAWSDYCRPIRDTKLYVPPRVSVPRVTTRYLKWWKRLNLGWSGGVAEEDVFGRIPQSPLSSTADIGALSGKGSCKISKRTSSESSLCKLSDYNARVSPPPGFAPRDSWVKESESGNGVKETRAELSSSGSCKNNQCPDDARGKHHCSSLECNQNNGVNPGPAQSSQSEVPGSIALEDRITNIEKLCAWIKAGKLICIS